MWLTFPILRSSFRLATPTRQGFLLPISCKKMLNETTKLKIAFNQESLPQTTSLEAMASKVQSYCENLSKYDATHGVETHHLFRTVNDSMNIIADMCHEEKSHADIEERIYTLWTVLRMIQQRVPQELFDDLDLLTYELNDDLKFSGKC